MKMYGNNIVTASENVCVHFTSFLFWPFVAWTMEIMGDGHIDLFYYKKSK